MNCKLTHDDNYVTFEFDKRKDIDGYEYKTVITFNKHTKTFSVRNHLDYYGQGYTLKIKEMNYAQRYLENKNLL